MTGSVYSVAAVSARSGWSGVDPCKAGSGSGAGYLFLLFVVLLVFVIFLLLLLRTRLRIRFFLVLVVLVEDEVVVVEVVEVVEVVCFFLDRFLFLFAVPSQNFTCIASPPAAVQTFPHL